MNTKSRSHLLLRLLPLSLVLAVEGVSRPVTDQNCPADITVDEAQESVNIGSGQPDHDGRLDFLTYVQPDEGFEGISLIAQARTSTATAWFSNNTCFFNVTPTAWWAMLARVTVVRIAKVQHFRFQLLTEACSDACLVQKNGTDELQSFHVEAYGPSRWRHEESDQGMCQVKNNLKPATRSNSSCVSPPQKTTTTATTPTYTPDKWLMVVIGAAVLVVVVVVVAAVVVLLERKRNRQGRHPDAQDVVTRPSQGASSPSEVVVVENSIYESFDNFVPRSPAMSGEREVVENTLYEPFDNFVPRSPGMSGEREVVENTLYEPFDNFRPRSPGMSVQREVVENTLYEPFENFQSPN